MSTNKTIAVMTSYYINNYGSVLQTYATKIFFQSLGLDVIFINYIRENVRNRTVINARWNNNIFQRMIYKTYKCIDIFSKKMVFDRFINNNVALTIPYATKSDLYKDIVDVDIYCVGSDQMWNSEYNGGVISENFLDFVPNGKKKISFSTSMGMPSFSDTEMSQMKRFLEDFSFISVREQEAKAILQASGIRNVHQILDPTLLMNKGEWKNNLQIKEKRNKYVLIYQLNENPEMQRFARNLASRENIEIRQITYYMSQHWEGIKSIYNPKVETFVSLIANAEYIVTDSFHGTAFSINLEKEFFSFSPKKYVGRINSLLSLTGLQSRFVEESDRYNIPQKIDYHSVEEILDKCRKEARTLLQEVLN